jgi:hypothetical protein
MVSDKLTRAHLDGKYGTSTVTMVGTKFLSAGSAPICPEVDIERSMNISKGIYTEKPIREIVLYANETPTRFEYTTFDLFPMAPTQEP